MLLIFARHGNTFGPGDTPVWVGAKEDLALTERGLEQSRQIGQALKEASVCPDRVIAGPLQRTRIGAQLAAEVCGFKGEIEIDQRLKEIDYGLWGGKSDEDIAATWGQTAIEDWRERNIAPTDAQWSPHPDTLRDNAIAFFDDLKTDHKSTSALVITSNGILRYFHPLFEGDNASPEEAKVKTGHWCVARRERTKVNPKCWNTTPDAKALIK